MIDVAIYAGNLASGQVLAALAAPRAWTTSTPTLPHSIGGLTRLLARG